MKCFRPITWSQESLTPHLFLRCFGNLCKVERFCNEVHRHYAVSIRAHNTHLLNPSGIGFSEPVIGTMAGGSPHYSQASCYVCCCKAGNQNFLPVKYCHFNFHWYKRKIPDLVCPSAMDMTDGGLLLFDCE